MTDWTTYLLECADGTYYCGCTNNLEKRLRTHNKGKGAKYTKKPLNVYAVMGCGCQSVSAVQTQYTESVRGVWEDGRVGTYRSIREHTGETGLGATVFGTKGIIYKNRYYDYTSLVVEIAKFFKTGRLAIQREGD